MVDSVCLVRRCRFDVSYRVCSARSCTFGLGYNVCLARSCGFDVGYNARLALIAELMWVVVFVWLVVEV